MSEESRGLQPSSLPDSSTSGAPNQYRILISDNDNRAVGCCDVVASLAAVREVEVCGRATNARETVRFAKRMRPDLIILGINLLAIGGINTVRQIRSALPATGVVVVTLNGSLSLRTEGRK